MPRICNHCLNAACVGACPSGAIYKRAEDGVVLINQDKCRGWRMCVSACPYKKTYYNWSTGKSEKCILCYPRLETGQAPACFHSCVGTHPLFGRSAVRRGSNSRRAQSARRTTRSTPARDDPRSVRPESCRRRERKRHPRWRDRGRAKFPVYQIRQRMGTGSALHPEYRTLPMLFYVPPLLPVLNATQENGTQRVETDLVQFAGKSPRASPLYVAHAFGWQRRTRYQSLSAR
jgi:nitrate reductase beta subunit